MWEEAVVAHFELSPTFAWNDRWKKPRCTSVRTISIRSRFETGTTHLQIGQISWSTVRLATALTSHVCSYCWINWSMKWLVSGLLQAANTRVYGNPTSRGIELSLLNVNWPRRVKMMALMEWSGCRPAASHSVTRSETPSQPQQQGWKAENSRSSCCRHSRPPVWATHLRLTTGSLSQPGWLDTIIYTHKSLRLWKYWTVHIRSDYKVFC
jgi:hypothetical protein